MRNLWFSSKVSIQSVVRLFVRRPFGIGPKRNPRRQAH